MRRTQAAKKARRSQLLTRPVLALLTLCLTHGQTCVYLRNYLHG